MQNTKQINCPEHPEGKHEATLYCWPDKLAGIWECPKTGSSDAHEHDNYEIEIFTHDTLDSRGEHDQYETEGYVCGGVLGCGVVIEDASPAEDRAEALADMQIMEARGK